VVLSARGVGKAGKKMPISRQKRQKIPRGQVFVFNRVAAAHICWNKYSIYLRLFFFLTVLPIQYIIGLHLLMTNRIVVLSVS